MSGGLLAADEDVLEPPIEDPGGYVITPRDLALLQIPIDMVQRWREHRVPLGMDDDEFEFFLQTLNVALELDAIPPCDVRLRGSSTAFFAFPRKRLPSSRGEISDLFWAETGDPPERFVLDRIERLIREHWPYGGDRPSSFPFDASYRLGIGLFPSDYDLQICSNEIDRRARALVTGLGTDPTPHRIQDPEYNYIRQSLVRKTCEHLALWSANCSKVLRRGVSIAAFPASGPLDELHDNGEQPARSIYTGWVMPRSNNG